MEENNLKSFFTSFVYLCKDFTYNYNEILTTFNIILSYLHGESKELIDAIRFGEVDSSRITNAIQNATETIFPKEEGFKVDAILYYGDEKGNVSIVKGDDTLGFDININI